MANEIGPVLYVSGQALRCTLTNEAGQVWDRVAGAWVAAAGATFANCLLTLMEQGTTGRYYADLPAGVAAAERYSVCVMLAAATGFADQASQIAEGVVEPQMPTNPLLATDPRLDHLDAAVSSRSTYAGGDTPGTTALLGRLTDTRAGRLDTVATVADLPADPDNAGIAVAASQATTAATQATQTRGILAGITLLSSWLRAMVRKDAASAVALAEINTGGGGYDPAAGAQQALAEQVAATKATADLSAVRLASAQAAIDRMGGTSIPPEPVGLSLAEVLAIINSPAGELITHIPQTGPEVQIRAVVERRANQSLAGQPMGASVLTLLLARDATYGATVITKGKTKFRVKPRPDLPEQVYTAEIIDAGAYYWNVTVV